MALLEMLGKFCVSEKKYVEFTRHLSVLSILSLFSNFTENVEDYGIIIVAFEYAIYCLNFIAYNGALLYSNICTFV